MSLVRGLPPGGALHRSLDPDGWQWTVSEELLATVVEVLDISNRLFIRAHTKEGTKMPDPLHIPRPHERTKPAFATGDDMERMAGPRLVRS